MSVSGNTIEIFDASDDYFSSSPKGHRNFEDRRCCSSLMDTQSTALLAPSQSSKFLVSRLRVNESQALGMLGSRALSHSPSGLQNQRKR